MAGNIGTGLNLAAQALIPETMQRMQMPGMIEQARRQQQVGDIQGRRLFGGADAEIGTPETKSYQVNGRTVGQDNASTVGPLFSPSKKMALFAEGNPDIARAALAQRNQENVFGSPGFSGTLAEGEVAFKNGKQVASGAPKARESAFPKAGTIRTFQNGLQTVTQQADGQGGWTNLATGPAYKPDSPEKPKDTFDSEAKLRSEFDNKTKDFSTIRDAAATIQTVANNPSPSGDIALIFSFMKMLDPGSTVREGEYATAQNAASVPETLRAKFNKIVDGETLTPGQRADFVRQANNVYTSKLGAFNSEYKRYSDLASQYKVDPSRVIYDRANGILPDSMQAGAPGGAPGTAMAAGPAGPPQAAIDYLRSNPDLAAQFDAKYGAGASKKFAQ